MGWDAHTNAKKNWNKHQLSNKEQRTAFKEAWEFEKRQPSTCTKARIANKKLRMFSSPRHIANAMLCSRGGK